MLTRHFFFFICITFPLLWQAPSLADTVELVDGRKLPCVVKDKTTNPVEIFTATGVLQIPQARIKNLVQDSAAANQLIRAEFKLNGGALAEAEKMVKEAQAAGIAKPALRDWLMRQRTTFSKHLKGKPAKEHEFWTTLTAKAAESDPAPSSDFLAGMAGSFAEAGGHQICLGLV